MTATSRDRRRSTSAQARLRGGNRRFRSPSSTTTTSPTSPDAEQRDRNLLVESLEVEGPIDAAGDPLPESHRKIIFRTPREPEEFSDCASAVAREVRHAALPPARDRRARSPSCSGSSTWPARMATLRARHPARRCRPSLVSPQFLFRVELDRGRRKPRQGQPGRHRRPAQRLRAGVPAVVLPLEQHARRRAVQAGRSTASCTRTTCSRRRSGGCSAIRRPQAFVENFAGQWLQLRNLKTVEPRHAASSRRSTSRSATAMSRRPSCSSTRSSARTGASSTSSTADYTFLNERLAKHYGIPGVNGDRVPPGDAQGRRSAAACSPRRAS